MLTSKCLVDELILYWFWVQIDLWMKFQISLWNSWSIDCGPPSGHAPDVLAESNTLNLSEIRLFEGFFFESKWKLLAYYYTNSYSKGVTQNEDGCLFNWISQNTGTIYLCTINVPFSVECNNKFQWRKMRQHGAVWCSLNTWIISSYYSDICAGKQITNLKWHFQNVATNGGGSFIVYE